MADRTWAVRINLDDLGAELLVLDDDTERGVWLTGFQVGAAGGPCRESWPEAKRLGWEFGARAFAEAEEFRAKKTAAGVASADARRQREGSAQPSRPNTVRTLLEHSPNTVRENQHETSNQPTANSHKPTTNNPEPTPLTPQGGRRVPRGAFTAPTEDEWVAYCTATWPDWHPQCAAESWAYYNSIRWRMRAGPIQDWKSAAKTSHGNAREWGKLQPKADPLPPPTLDEWFSEGARLNRSAPRGTPEWSAEAAEAVWYENDAKGWRYVTNWKSAIFAAYNRFLGNEQQFANRRSR